MNMRERRELKANATNALSNVDFGNLDMEFMGFTVEGALFFNREKDVFMVATAVVKNDNFDAHDSLDEFEEREAARKEREVERQAKEAEKEAKRLAREKEKAEKEAAKAND